MGMWRTMVILGAVLTLGSGAAAAVLNVGQNATYALPAGTHAYDSVSIHGTLVISGATTILTDSFHLNGVIHGFGRDGAHGADARMVGGSPHPPGNGAPGFRGHDLTIYSSGLMELSGNIALYGGRGGSGGDVNTQLMSAAGGRGGNGATAGSLFIQATFIDFSDFHFAAWGGDGGDGGNSRTLNPLNQIPGGRGGDGGDGGYVYASIVRGEGAGYRVPTGGFSGINNEPGGAGGAGGRGTGILGFATGGSDGSNGELWLATVPEPASLSLLALGGVALFRRQRA